MSKTRPHQSTGVKKLDHSPYSASTCGRWWYCPGTIKMSKAIPETPPTPYMVEGTLAHHVAEQVAKGVLAGESKALRDPIIDTVKTIDGLKVAVTREMIDCAYEYYGMIEDVMLQYGIPKKSVQFERSVVVSKERELWGTSDWSGNSVEVIASLDFKYGAGTFVKADKNKQLQYYALGVYEEMPESEKEKISTVVYGICQPRMNNIYVVEQPIEDLMAFKDELFYRRNAIDATPDKLVPGDHCSDYFCPAKGVCPAYQKWLKDESDYDIQAMAELVTTPAALEFTPEQIATAYSNIDRLKQLIKDVEAEALRYAMAGNLPGHKAVKKYGTLAWKPGAQAKLKSSGLLNDDCFKSPDLKTPTQLKKVLGAELIEKYAEKPHSGFEVVPETDKRPAFKNDALEDFSDIEL